MGPSPRKNSKDPTDAAPNIPAVIPTTKNSDPQVNNRGVKESVSSAHSGNEPPTLKSLQQQQGISLTKVSKMYDIDGDGKLDEAEQAMRDMDISGRGYLANEKVYALMQDNLKMQREMFRFKKVMIGLVAFVVILSLCNLGSSFAAAYLAKDTTTNSQKQLVNSKTKEVISTQTTSESFEIERIAEDQEEEFDENEIGDERSLLTYYLSSYLSIAYSRGERMIRRCYSGSTISVVRTWHDGTETSITVCPPKDGDYKQNDNGKYISVFLNNGINIKKNDHNNEYRIWGDTFTQDEGHVCDVKADCDTGLICPESDGAGRVCRYAGESESCDGSNVLCEKGLVCMGDNVCTTPTTTTTTTTTTPTTTITTTTNSGYCCYEDGYDGYQSCSVFESCNESEGGCNDCEGFWLDSPYVPTGCCSHNGGECQNSVPVCDYLESDCIQCGGTWQNYTTTTTTTTTNTPTTTLGAVFYGTGCVEDYTCGDGSLGKCYFGQEGDSLGYCGCNDNDSCPEGEECVLNESTPELFYHVCLTMSTTTTATTTTTLPLDSDGDGVLDYDEENVYYTDPNDTDTDGDGLSDGYEITYGLDPLNADEDSDGNLDSYDTDKDGLPDVLESLIGTERNNSDSDGDRLSDWQEYIHNGTNPLSNDTDSDMFEDADEVNQGFDPNNPDWDGDGLLDGWEFYIYDTNAFEKDTDFDGVDDPDEIFVYNTDPKNPDSDGDGITDGEEILNGSNPLEPETTTTIATAGTTTTTTSVTTTTTINFSGSFITKAVSSRAVAIPSPPEPESGAPRTSCPHLESGLLSWNDENTWSSTLGHIPMAGEDVLLPDNSKVIVSDSVVEELGVVTIPPTSELIFSENENGITMDIQGMDVQGSLRAGSETCRYEGSLSITLHGSRPSDIVTNPLSPTFKGISVDGGTIDLHGERFYPTWSRLAQTVPAGQSYILLQDNVNWKPGHEIVLVTTAVHDSYLWHQNEVSVVLSVENDPVADVGSVVYLTSPTQYEHIANDGYQAEVGLLSRNIIIQGAPEDSEFSDPDPGTCSTTALLHGSNDNFAPCEGTRLTGFGGHVVVHSGGKGYVEGVELYRMGQTNVVGRYPMHFSLLGDGCSDCYFKDSSVHRSFYRCISIHGTNDLVVSENVGYDVMGYCYHLESGVEESNEISYNLAAHIHPVGGQIAIGDDESQTISEFAQSDMLILPADVTSSGYWISNLNNTVVGNSASGGWSGYVIPVLLRPIGPLKDSNFRPANRLSDIFDGNTAHSTGWWWSRAGAFYIGGSLYYGGENDSYLVYDAGRDVSRSRSPCLVDKCLTSNSCDSYCQPHEQAWNQFSNSKTFLVPSTGFISWSGRAEIMGFEAHDVGLGLEALSGGFGVDNLYVVCRSGQPWAMPECSAATDLQGNGVFLYSTNQEHIISNAYFKNCGYRSDGYNQYESAPDRGCSDDSDTTGCDNGSSVWGFRTHSDMFAPEVMLATSNVQYEDCGRLFKLHDYRTDNAVSTVSGRIQSWLDIDGTASPINEPSIVGSGLSDAGHWWKVDENTWSDPQGPLEFIKINDGPERGLGHMRMRWKDSIHNTVGVTSCGDGDGLPCPALGRIRHIGPLFDSSNDALGGLPITANPEVTGPVGGFGWLLTLDGGAPKTLIIDSVEVDSSTPMVLAIAYPAGTTFSIAAHASNCTESQSYTCTESFGPVNSVDEVRNSLGNKYFFEYATNLLWIRVVQPPESFTGIPEWSLWDNDTPGEWGIGFALERFTFNGITLPIMSRGPYLEIIADCAETAIGSGYCAGTPAYVEPDVCPGSSQISYDMCLNSPTTTTTTTATDTTTTAAETTATTTIAESSPCCYDRNTGYQECNTDNWCNSNESECSTCGGVFSTSPVERNGCCSWGGSECSDVDPDSNPGCQYLQSDCEGSCGGTWQSFPDTTTTATTTDATTTTTIVEPSSCCYDRDTGYQTCLPSYATCSMSEHECNSCGDLWLTSPIVQSGCCSLDGSDCSDLDPDLVDSPNCQYLQSDCENECSGTWQPFATTTTTTTTTTTSTTTTTFIDSDGDGLADIVEASLGTDPNNPDSDGDGIMDGLEVTYGLDPLNADEDGDGNPDGQNDSDGDMLPDILETLIGTDPNNQDSDGDSLFDGQEVIDLGTDPNNPDSDGDGLNDGEELALGTNPNNSDSDGDNLEDKFEIDSGLDPNNPDVDGDGLSDGDEMNVYFTDPNNPDTDGDSLFDGDEVLNGSDPLDPTSGP